MADCSLPSREQKNAKVMVDDDDDDIGGLEHAATQQRVHGGPRQVCPPPPFPCPFSSARIETRALTVMSPLVRQVRGAVYAHDVERSAPSSNGGAAAGGAAVNSQVAAMFSATRAWEAKN